MMWWAVWCVALVAGGASTLAAPASNSLTPLSSGDWTQLDPAAPDDDSYGYAMPSLGGRYAAAPWFYLLSDLPHDSQVRKRESSRRLRRSFSVNPAVDLLQRGAYNNYVERQANANRDFLNCIGKREAGGSSRASEAQDAVAVHQQPDGGAASAAAARGGPQADARGQPAAGRRQPRLPAERRQTRFLDARHARPLRQLGSRRLPFSFRSRIALAGS